MSTKLLLAQDFALVRSGVRRALERSPEIRVIAETGAATELVTLTRRTRPDAVLLDLEMQGRPTVTYLQRVRDGVADVPVIVVADPKRIDDSGDLFRQGAASVILTTIELDELGPAIAAVVSGARGQVFGTRPPELVAAGAVLSPREIETLKAVGLGLSNRAIAARLSVTEHTVKFHLTSVYRKLGLQSRTEAAHWAIENGLVARWFTSPNLPPTLRSWPNWRVV